MKQFISLEEAVDILDNHVIQMPQKEVGLLEAVGYRVSETICAPICVPMFNKSAMDGYAVYVEDGLVEDTELVVIDEVFAGHIGDKQVSRGTAVKIMTGAPIPQGANAVIKKEEVQIQGTTIAIKAKVVIGQNICFAGEDVKQGQVLVDAQKKLAYGDIGLLASCGIEKVPVYTKPKVAFISTGDELCEVGEVLGVGKIYNSNKYSLLARLMELGFQVDYVHHVEDGQEAIGEAIMQASKQADLVLTTGGVSVGDKDLLQAAVEGVGGEKLFWKILIKPGSAMLCSRINNKIVLSLSGNPTAALTTFELLARPVLEKMAGASHVSIQREKAVLQEAITKTAPQKRFIRGCVYSNDGHQEVLVTQIKSGNGILSSTIGSNCIIEIPANTSGLVIGSMVDIIKL